MSNGLGLLLWEESKMLGRQPVESVSIDLPRPISANRIWRNVVIGGKPRTLRSKEYLAWVSTAGAMLNAQRPGIVEGHYALTITVSRECRLDLDNAIKATNDLLQSQGVIENDKLCREITVRRGDCDGMSVLIVSTKSLALKKDCLT